MAAQPSDFGGVATKDAQNEKHQLLDGARERTAGSRDFALKVPAHFTPPKLPGYSIAAQKSGADHPILRATEKLYDSKQQTGHCQNSQKVGWDRGVIFF